MSDYQNLKDYQSKTENKTPKFKKINFNFNKKLLALVIVLIIGIPLTINLSGQQQIIEKQASGPSVRSTSDMSLLVLKYGTNKVSRDRSGRIKISPNKRSKDSLVVARDRKKKMLELAEKNPKEFLLNALPSSVTKNLPASVQNEVEKEANIKGNIIVVHYDDIKRKRSKYEYLVRVVNKNKKVVKTYTLRSVKPLPNVQTGSSVSVKGYSLDNKLVIQGGEGAGQNELNTSGFYVYDYTKQNPLGKQNILAILINFSNDKRQPVTKTELRNILFSDTANSIKSFYKTNSYGKSQIEGTVVGYFTLPFSNIDCGTSYNWGSAAQAVAYNRGINISNYNRILYIFPTQGNCWAPAWATVGGIPSEAWMTDVKAVGIYAHEIGHNFGSSHANSLNCGDKSISDFEFGYPSSCSSQEYGDPTDVMGGTSWTNIFQFNAPHKEEENYLTGNQIITVNSNTSVSVNALENNDSSIKAIRIPISDSDNYYYVSFRKAVNYDQDLPSGITKGVNIHLWNKENQVYNDSIQTQLIDNTIDNGSSGNFSDSSLSDGLTFNDSQNGISIKQISHDLNKATIEVKVDNSVCRHFIPEINFDSLSQVGLQGEELTYNAAIKNNDSDNCEAANFSAYGYPAGNGTFDISSDPVSINPGETKTIALKVKSSTQDAIGIYRLRAFFQSQFPRHKVEAQLSYIVNGELSWVSINPYPVEATIGKEPSIVIAPAYDQNAKRILGGVNYAWELSSDNNIGTLGTTNSDTNLFTPLRPGSGEIKVTATFNNVSTTTTAPVVVRGSLSPTPTPPVIQIMKINSSADSYVRKDKPNANFGTNGIFQTSRTPATIAYMKFNLSKLKGKKIISAKLRFKVSSSSSSLQNLKRADDKAWSESSLKYTNKPGFSASLVSFSPDTNGKIIELDVVSSVKLKKGSNLTFGITSNGSTATKFYSRQTADSLSRPELIIEYQ